MKKADTSPPLQATAHPDPALEQKLDDPNVRRRATRGLRPVVRLLTRRHRTRLGLPSSRLEPLVCGHACSVDLATVLGNRSASDNAALL